MVDFNLKPVYNINDLLSIVKLLRGEGGCPWDREQNHQSIRKDLLEETYEVIDAIDRNDTEALQEELGDLLLQVVFHSQIENENGNFDFNNVANDICKKLIVRHPHVFGEVKVSDTSEVLKNWDEIKKQTKNQQTYTETLKSVPEVFPALIRGNKILKRAERAGFDTDVAFKSSIDDDMSNVTNDDTLQEDKEKAIGNMLLYVCNLSRKYNIDPEEALRAANKDFIKKFESVENNVRQKETEIKFLSINELDALWHEAEKCLNAE